MAGWLWCCSKNSSASMSVMSGSARIWSISRCSTCQTAYEGHQQAACKPLWFRATGTLNIADYNPAQLYDFKCTELLGMYWRTGSAECRAAKPKRPHAVALSWRFPMRSSIIPYSQCRKTCARGPAS